MGKNGCFVSLKRTHVKFSETNIEKTVDRIRLHGIMNNVQGTRYR